MEINRSALLEKWAPVIDMDGAPSVKDAGRRGDLAVILENQAREMSREAAAQGMLSETTSPTNAGGSATGGINTTGTGSFTGSNNGAVSGFDPVLINLVRRAMPQLIEIGRAHV